MRIAAPVQIRISLRGASRLSLSAVSLPQTRNEAKARLRTHIARALTDAVRPFVTPRAVEAAGPVSVAAAEDATASEPALEWLVRKARAGELAPLLRLIGEEALEQWAECVILELPFEAPAPAVSPPPPAGWIELLQHAREHFRLTSSPPQSPPARRERMQLLLFLAAAFVAKFGVRGWLASREMRMFVVRAVFVAEDRGSVPVIEAPAEQREVARESSAQPKRATRTEFDIPSALPFLLLNPLADAGYWQALDAALDVARMRGEAPLFAAALALEVADRDVAAVFAGLETIEDAPLGGFLRRFAPFAPILDASLIRAFAKGFHPGDRLIVTEVEGGWVVGEADCRAPIAFVESEEQLREVIAQFPKPLVVRAKGTRPRSIAVDAAMATIAWTLWHDREPCDAALAIERFRTLSALVRFDGSTVRIRLPLGRRFLDLKEHGLLDSVSGLPWLPGRDVVFTGG